MRRATLAFALFGLAGAILLIPTWILVVGFAPVGAEESAFAVVVAVPLSAAVAGAALSSALMHPPLWKWGAVLLPFVAAGLLGPVAWVVAFIAGTPTPEKAFNWGVGTGILAIVPTLILPMVAVPMSWFTTRVFQALATSPTIR